MGREVFATRGPLALRKAETADARVLASQLRIEDVREVWASHHLTPCGALDLSIRSSALAYTVEMWGQPEICFGVAPATVLSSSAVPWMLASDRIRAPELRTALLRFSRPLIGAFLERWSPLVNYVDARNAVSLRWLRWCGFSVDPPAPYGAEGLPFRRVELKRKE